MISSSGNTKLMTLYFLRRFLKRLSRKRWVFQTTCDFWTLIKLSFKETFSGLKKKKNYQSLYHPIPDLSVEQWGSEVRYECNVSPFARLPVTLGDRCVLRRLLSPRPQGDRVRVSPTPADSRLTDKDYVTVHWKTTSL